ncbi:hypothetical protein [Streptomyces sp. NPDC018045]|uniref:hypothetical protein n=1 Tax=Streptomyces sp. NPDC018045 TaxID=3365037 RepID=UPI0037AE7312
MATDTVAAPGAVQDAGGGPLAGRVPTPGGFTISRQAADWAARGIPRNTGRARESRAGLYEAWCREYGRIGTDAGALVDYAAYLASRQHPSETITTYITPLYHLRAMSGHPVRTDERLLVQQIINARSAEEATAPDGQGDALQATECTRADLVAMLATLDRATVRGRRDALALVLAWYLGARASEVPALALRDVRRTRAVRTDPATGERTERAGLHIVIRRSKTNPHGKRRHVVRLMAQDDVTCPVAAYDAWREVLAAAGVAERPGPLLRRVRANKLTTAGRPPADARWREGIGDRTLRNLIAERAAAAELTRPLEPEERRLLSVLDERAELAAAAPELHDTIRVRRRLSRRALRRELPRYTGQSMRRGQVRDQQRRGVPRWATELHCRYAPGSTALARYQDDELPWDANPSNPAASWLLGAWAASR